MDPTRLVSPLFLTLATVPDRADLRPGVQSGAQTQANRALWRAAEVLKKMTGG